MALQKLWVNCLIFVLASRQVRPCRNEVRIRVVQTASSYNSREILQIVLRRSRILRILRQVDYAGFVFPFLAKQTARHILGKKSH